MNQLHSEKPVRRSLFDIGDDLAAMERLIEECNGDISDPAAEAAIAAWMNELETDIAVKADRYVALMHKWESDGVAARAEIDQYRKIVECRDARVKRLRQILQTWMEQHNRPRVETFSGRTIAVQGNGGVQPMQVDEAYVIGELEKYTGIPALLSGCTTSDVEPFLSVTVDLDRDKLRRHLATGNTLPWATLLERGKSLRIR